MKIKCRPNSKRVKKFKLRWQNEHGLNCAHCGIDCSGFSTIDHVVPLSKGGGNTLKNMVIACLECNQSKADKTVEEFKQLLLKPLEDSSPAGLKYEKDNRDFSNDSSLFL